MIRRLRLAIFSTRNSNDRQFHGVNTPLVAVSGRSTVSSMNLLVLLIVLMLVFGGGGFYFGGPLIGGGGFGLILLICLVLFLTGNLGRR
jgi:hypothetical protein